MKITSDLGDPTVAGQQVPLLPRGEDGQELDWRKTYACLNDVEAGTCSDDNPCAGCKGLNELLHRLRNDRRLRAARPASSPGEKRISQRKSDDDVV